MREKLRDIRKPKAIKSKTASVRSTVLIFLFGIVTGFAAKWLDSLVFDDTIPWLRVMERLDLGNLFTAHHRSVQLHTRQGGGQCICLLCRDVRSLSSLFDPVQRI